MNKELSPKDIISPTNANHYHIGSDLQFGEDYANYPSREEFGKVMYLVYNGSLRQFRIKNVVVFPFNYGIRKKHDCGIYHNITTIEVAGIGILYVGLYMYGGNFDCKIYESVEDYKAGKEYKMKYTRISKENCEKRFGVKFVHLNFLRNKVLQRWHWNGTSACLHTVTQNMPICYLVEKDGIFFHDGWSPKELDGYSTKEECEADSKVSVCCFDEPKKFSIRAYETFSRTFEVEAANYDAAVEKVRKELESFPFEEGDSNGLCFY